MHPTDPPPADPPLTNQAPADPPLTDQAPPLVRPAWRAPIRYDATAQRTNWADLPAEVRAVIEAQLGGRVSAVVPAGAGFTRGFAAVLAVEPAEPGPTQRGIEPAEFRTKPARLEAASGPPTDGTRVFVKASDIDYLVEAYRREALVTAALPAEVPATRLRWTTSIGTWYVLCLESINGRTPAFPWRATELRAALTAWARAAEALASRTSRVLPRGGWHFADLARTELTNWQEIDAHRAPLPAMPRYALAYVTELAELERKLPELATGCAGIMHGDLRLDNVLVSPAGDQAWLCDWAHTCYGPAWFDTISLLVTGYASGFDADTLFAAHPTARQAPPHAVDVALAALAGHWLTSAGRASAAAPSIAVHQRFSGEVALRWLAERRGWHAE